jgi:hypothetical protein
LHHTTHAWKLLHKNGSYTTQTVPSVRTAAKTSSIANQYLEGGLKTTIKPFLSTIAITTTDEFAYHADGVTGLVWNSSQLVSISAAKGIHVPLLTMGNLLTSELGNISIECTSSAQHASVLSRTIVAYRGRGIVVLDPTAFDVLIQGWVPTTSEVALCHFDLGKHGSSTGNVSILTTVRRTHKGYISCIETKLMTGPSLENCQCLGRFGS